MRLQEKTRVSFLLRSSSRKVSREWLAALQENNRTNNRKNFPHSRVAYISKFEDLFLWLTFKLAGAFPQILLVISAGRIETIATCKNHIKHCILLYCIAFHWIVIVLCRVVSCRVVSCRVVSCRVVSCRVVSCRVVSCCVVSYWIGLLLYCIVPSLKNKSKCYTRGPVELQAYESCCTTGEKRTIEQTTGTMFLAPQTKATATLEDQ